MIPNGDILIVIYTCHTFILFAVFGVMLYDSGILPALAEAQSEPDRLDELIASKKEKRR